MVTSCLAFKWHSRKLHCGSRWWAEVPTIHDGGRKYQLSMMVSRISVSRSFRIFQNWKVCEPKNINNKKMKNIICYYFLMSVTDNTNLPPRCTAMMSDSPLTNARTRTAEEVRLIAHTLHVTQGVVPSTGVVVEVSCCGVPSPASVDNNR